MWVILQPVIMCLFYNIETFCVLIFTYIAYWGKLSTLDQV